MSTPLLSCRGLQVSIGGSTVVQGLELELAAGQRLAILGRNGVGKTTLLHSLAGLRAVAAGEVRLCGAGYAEQGARLAARRRGLLAQQQADAFPATVLEAVLAGRHPHLSRWAWESAADEALARAALAELGLGALAARAIHRLSGGERQRVALATLLVQQPQLYLLDEPLAHLDLNHQIAVLQIFSRRARPTEGPGAALVMVLHDVNLAMRFADRVLLLFGEGEQLLLDCASLDTALLSRLYGHPLRELSDGTQRWFVAGGA